MPRFLLIRHAESALQGSFCGSSDPGLSARGQEQLQELGAKLAGYPISHIFCSPQQRARLTAEAVPRAVGVAFTILDSLREIHFGEWEGLAWAEVERRDPEFTRRWVEQFPEIPAPGGEPFVDFRDRVEAAWGEIRKAAGDDPDAVIAIVAHGGVLQVLQAMREQRKFQDVRMLKTASFVVIEITGH